jgi:hypothetical protein
MAIASQGALQVSITHHGIMPNNPDLVPILINLFLQQFIIATTNILPTIDAPTFVDIVGNSFEFLN